MGENESKQLVDENKDLSRRIHVLVATDFSVCKCDDRIYTKFAFSSIIERYSKEFGDLCLCCPVKTFEIVPDSFVDITYIVKNIISVTRKDALLCRINNKLKNYLLDYEVIIGRLPGFIPLRIAKIVRKKKTYYFSEVMGCGWDAYWNHGILGKLVAPYMYLNMKSALKQSQFALYVTEQFLQKRYPCQNPSVGVSNVVIDDIADSILAQRTQRISSMNQREITLMTSAAVDVWYKGQHYVIRSIPKLNEMGIRVKYYCVGQGDPSYLQKIAKKCKVEDQVFFTGAVPHDRVFELLDDCDIYVQPSLQEGLPRALVEAMSRGCPAVGARTGGIPELIPEACVVKRKSVHEIAQKIKMMLDDGLESYAETNFNRAKDFQKNILNERRNSYFEYVKKNVIKE